MKYPLLLFNGYRFSRFIPAVPDSLSEGPVDLNLNESLFQMYGTGDSMGVYACVCV